MTNQEGYSERTFESIKNFTDYGTEFWNARELAEVLGYTK